MIDTHRSGHVGRPPTCPETDDGLRFRTVVETMVDGAVLLDPVSLQVAYANPAGQRMLDHTSEATATDSIGRAARLWPELTGKQIRELVRSLGDGGTWTSELRIPDAGMATRTFELRAQMVDGLLLAAARDVTDRVASAEALAASEERFRDLANNAYDGIYVAHLYPTYHFTYVNPALERSSGYPAQAWYDDPELPLQRVHPDDRALIESTRTEMDGISWPLVVRWRRPDGSWVWHSLRETPLCDRAGRLVAMQGLALDVTTQQQQQLALQQTLEQERAAAEELRELDAIKNAFLQAVSHELRTPLTSVIGYAVTLREHWAQLQAEQIARMLDRTVTTAQRLGQLLADLLDLDRLANGLIEPQLKPCDVEELIARCVADVPADRHHLRFDLCPTPAEVDCPKVERIVENLVRNAIKHTPAGTTVWVRVWPEGDEAHLVVEDDGPGLADDQRKAVFDAFKQGPASRDDPSPGLGLGLALVRRFCELHHGRVWVDDSPSGGAAFHVVLPRYKRGSNMSGPMRGSDPMADRSPPAA